MKPMEVEEKKPDCQSTYSWEVVNEAKKEAQKDFDQIQQGRENLAKATKKHKFLFFNAQR